MVVTSFLGANPLPRKLRHPNSNPVTIASRSMSCPSPGGASLKDDLLVQERAEADQWQHSAWANRAQESCTDLRSPPVQCSEVAYAAILRCPRYARIAARLYGGRRQMGHELFVLFTIGETVGPASSTQLAAGQSIC